MSGLGIVIMLTTGLLPIAGCSPQRIEPVSIIDVSPREGYAPLAVEFDGSYSFFEDGDATWYSWTFGDGSAVSRFASDMPLGVIEHTYDSEGIYIASLTVQDSEGRSDSAEVAIIVSRVPPTAVFSGLPDIGEVPLTVSLDASESSASGVSIVDFIWDFGDGSVGEGAETSYTYRYPGTFVVAITVIDENGDIGTASRLLYITPPIMVDSFP